MKTVLMTMFGQRDVRLAELWAAGLQQFWPEHPPAIVLGDGNVPEPIVQDIAQRVGGTTITEDEKLTRLHDAGITDATLRLRAIGPWLRKLYDPYVVTDADMIVWDDVDGLFMRRPSHWIQAIFNQMTCCMAVPVGHCHWTSGQVWERVDPTTPQRNVPAWLCDGTAAFPRATIASRLDKVQLYTEIASTIISPAEEGAGVLHQLGCWQYAVQAQSPKIALLPQTLYQLEAFNPTHPVELYHACDAKYTEWFWQGFLDGYAEYVADPSAQPAKPHWCRA